jgi:hypothetical protein
VRFFFSFFFNFFNLRVVGIGKLFLGLSSFWNILLSMGHPFVTPDSEVSTVELGSLEDDCPSPMIGKFYVTDDCRSGDSSRSRVTNSRNIKSLSWLKSEILFPLNILWKTYKIITAER